MSDPIASLKNSFHEEFKKAATTGELYEIKVRYLGKKGFTQALMQELRNTPAEERPLFGKKVNELKESIESSIEKKQKILREQEMLEALKQEYIDVTAPGRRQFLGNKHVLTQGIERIVGILQTLGFSVQYGPDIETDYYNFEALNFPEDHPARDMQDTFYLDKKIVLRTHTTNIQLRMMEEHGAPFRVAAPGKVYRNEEVSARSHVFFHQVDFFAVDKDIGFSDLLATLKELFSRFFERDVEFRFRPSYFPFVEPGLEADVRCLNCGGAGCSLCKHTGWLEVAGAGMIHPEVLKNGGLDPEVWSGFAAGLGVERLVMLTSGISDIRNFTENNQKFLEQFTL